LPSGSLPVGGPSAPGGNITGAEGAGAPVAGEVAAPPFDMGDAGSMGEPGVWTLISFGRSNSSSFAFCSSSRSCWRISSTRPFVLA